MSAICVALALFLAAGHAAHRRYWEVPASKVATTIHTHVCTRGILAQRVSEADGDIHLRLQDAGAFVIAEVIPEIPVALPPVGAWVEVCGIARYDRDHRWPELHPVLRIRKVGTR